MLDIILGLMLIVLFGIFIFMGISEHRQTTQQRRETHRSVISLLDILYSNECLRGRLLSLKIKNEKEKGD